MSFRFLLIVVLISITTGGFFIACSVEDDSEGLEISNNEKSLNPLWQEQLNLIVKDNPFKNSGLVLKKIEYISQITNYDEIKSEILTNTFLPIHQNSIISLRYFSKIDDTQKGIQFIEQLISKSFETNDIGIVNMEWEYKGEILNTICVVSDKKGIVYDNILFNIPVKRNVQDKSQIVENLVDVPNVPRLKSGTEILPNGTYTYTWSKLVDDYNILGQMLYYMKMEAIMIFNVSNGQKNITGHSVDAYYSSDYGWSAVADIHTKSFSTGTGGHFNFVWGYNYGWLTSVSASFNGYSIVISNNGTGGNGEKYVTTSSF